MTRADPQMKLRLPESLKDQVDAAARAAGRSMNAEIVARLQASFQNKATPLGAFIKGAAPLLPGAASDDGGEALALRLEAMMRRVMAEAATTTSDEKLRDLRGISARVAGEEVAPIKPKVIRRR